MRLLACRRGDTATSRMPVLRDWVMRSDGFSRQEWHPRVPARSRAHHRVGVMVLLGAGMLRHGEAEEFLNERRSGQARVVARP